MSFNNNIPNRDKDNFEILQEEAKDEMVYSYRESERDME